jgi:hypothetical protein
MASSITYMINVAGGSPLGEHAFKETGEECKKTRSSCLVMVHVSGSKEMKHRAKVAMQLGARRLSIWKCRPEPKGNITERLLAGEVN